MERKELKEKAKQLLDKYKWFALPVGIVIFLAFVITIGYTAYATFQLVRASRELHQLNLAGSTYLDSAPIYNQFNVRTNFVSIPTSFLISIAAICSLLVIKFDLNNWKELLDKITFKKIGRIILAGLLVFIKTFLWALLFIIPGIIKSYEYALVIPLVATDDEITFKEAFRQSKEKMMGHKLDLFILGLSFIGWILLSYVLVGLPLIYVMPYFIFTLTLFYIERGV